MVDGQVAKFLQLLIQTRFLNHTLLQISVQTQEPHKSKNWETVLLTQIPCQSFQVWGEESLVDYLTRDNPNSTS